ncbi:uncharacterized protein LOC141763821 isoform X1 [Sebastes fasciatus]|uniref:uncharacterized protein LOC141763821 isoform X1 n=1 Tax=Sebastes fasciatus TaxID=394691 RepID=UPI003D9F4ABD
MLCPVLQMFLFLCPDVESGVTDVSLSVSRCCVRCYRCFSFCIQMLCPVLQMFLCLYPDVVSGVTDVSLSVSRCCVRCYRFFLCLYPDVVSVFTDVSFCIQMLCPVLQMFLFLCPDVESGVTDVSLSVSRCCARCYRCFSICIQMLCQVVYSCVVVLAAGFCCLVSATGLSQGPLCLYNTSSGPTWGVPLHPVPDRHAGYLYNRTLWSGVCLEPRGVVQWNVVLFSVMGGASGLQVLLCGANVLNSLLGLILGQGFCQNKVSPVSD